MPIVNNTQYVDRTSAITRIPFKPNLLSALGLFKEETSTADVITFDERENKLVVLDDHLRNTDKANGIDPKEYKQHLLAIPHYPQESLITVKQLKGIRNFDTDVEQAIEGAVAEHLVVHTEKHDYHLEYLMATMLGSGQMATTNFGTFDMFMEFEVTKKESEIDFTMGSVLEPQFRAITNDIKKSFTNGRSKGYIVLCGTVFFDAFVGHPDIKEAYALKGDSPLRNELGEVANGYNMFQYGNITFIQYDDTFSVGTSSVSPIADDAAVVLPRGSLGSVFFGPVSKLSGIGKAGAKRFSSTYRDPKDRYVEVESEQNSLVVLQEINAVHFVTAKLV